MNKVHSLGRDFLELRRKTAKGYTCPVCGDLFSAEPKLWDHGVRNHPEYLEDLEPMEKAEGGVRKRFREEALYQTQQKACTGKNFPVTADRPLRPKHSTDWRQPTVAEFRSSFARPARPASSPSQVGSIVPTPPATTPSGQEATARYGPGSFNHLRTGGAEGESGPPNDPFGAHGVICPRSRLPREEDTEPNRQGVAAKESVYGRGASGEQPLWMRNPRYNSPNDTENLPSHNKHYHVNPVHHFHPPNDPYPSCGQAYMADKNTVYPPSPDDEPEMLLQPETRPVCHEQLVVDVKGIYAGLVMVEAKCIAIDDMQAAPAQEKGTSDTAELKSEQWQSLIALQKQLLHEHQDFWLASQHTTASVVLRNLAAKYDMRARMRRHGIHAFLETLGYRLPDSPEHVLAFPYIAYPMTALLYQTVPAFEDSWFECLGDLGNYITATEDDELKDHEAWNNVARLWYRKASDKSTAMGRRYYHLTILTRPYALEQLSLYTRSLICITNSITTSFNPILYGKGTMQCRPSVLEPVLIKTHALFFISKHADSYDLFTASVKELRKGDFLGKCIERPNFKESGVSACISNIAALCEYGSAKDRPFRSRLRSVLKVSQVIGEGIKACFHGLLGPAESPTTKDYNMRMITLNCLYTYFNWLTEGFVPDAIDDREPLLERAPWHNHLLARLLWLRGRIPSVCLVLGTLVSLLDRFPALQRMYQGRVTRGVSGVTDVATSTWAGFGRSAHFQKPASVVSMSLLLQFAGASPISKPEHGGRPSVAEFFPFTALGSSVFALVVVFVALYLVPRKGPIRVWGCVMAGSAYAWLMIRNDPTATLSLSTPVLGVWSISTYKYGLTTFKKFEIPDTFSLIVLLLTMILDFSIVRFMTPTGVAISQSDLISVSLPSMSLTLAVAVNLIASVKRSAEQQGMLSPTHDVDTSDVRTGSQHPIRPPPGSYSVAHELAAS